MGPENRFDRIVGRTADAVRESCMRNSFCRTISFGVAALILSVVGSLQADDSASLRVTVDNFIRAESDNYFSAFEKEGGFGKFHHTRTLAPIDMQTVIRLNRDTLYSMGVFDLDAAPVTVTIPDPGKRFLSVLVISEDHYATEVIYTPGPHTITREGVGTRYVVLAVRIFVNPSDPDDVKQVNALQDAFRVDQKSKGTFAVPKWDQESLKRMRDALNGVAAANGGLNSARMFGRKDQVDPVQHLIGTAAGWGGNPAADATYFGGEAENNDGKTAYRLTLKDVPVDGFWSISVYNKAGFFEKNPQDAYTLNDVTAKPSADGSVTIQFGECDGKTQNCLPITPGWNYLVRLYRPRKEIVDGQWKLPKLEPVK